MDSPSFMASGTGVSFTWYQVCRPCLVVISGPPTNNVGRRFGWAVQARPWCIVSVLFVSCVLVVFFFDKILVVFVLEVVRLINQSIKDEGDRRELKRILTYLEFNPFQPGLVGIKRKTRLIVLFVSFFREKSKNKIVDIIPP